VTLSAPTAVELLAAPRGRRLCLELALAAEPGLSAVVFDAERAFHPADGSVAVLRFGEGADEPMPPPAEPAEVRRAIDRIPRAAIEAVLADDAMLLGRLAATVDGARYWQPPDARDALAAVPEVASSLARIAEALAAGGPLGRWSAPFDGSGWRVEFETARSDPHWPGDADAVLAAWGEASAREEAHFAAEATAHPEVLWSGSWWSWPTRLASTSDAVAGTPCGLALVEDDPLWSDALVTPARGTGRVLELDEEAWVGLCREYPQDVSASRRGDWGRTTGRTGAWVLPDWSAVAAEWDAVHLSIAQYLVLAGRPLAVDAERASLIAGWSPGVTAWLRGLVRTTGEPERWRRPDSGEWARVTPPPQP
jgi:hypothetical protein